MKLVRPFLVGAASLLLSGLISIVLLALVGLILPTLAMTAIFGLQNVQDAPGHGSIVLFLTVPIAGFLSLFAWVCLTALFYKKFSN